jgi:hypothetical protein
MKLISESDSNGAYDDLQGEDGAIRPFVIERLLPMGGVGVAVGGWFLAHRHGRLQGFVDANENGIDDSLEVSK